MTHKASSPCFDPSVPWWQPVLFSAMAGGMAWGIRGQYGHETGAMIAGLLVSLTLAYLLAPKTPPLNLFRAVAWGTLAMGIGGSMTYGQTLGLTQNPPVIGNWESLRWGFLGVAVKGGVWIGFAGLFFGMGLSSVKYRPKEIFGLMLGVLVAYKIGIYLLNSPFDPANNKLPYLYFSEHWHWYPDKEDLKPRYECWGGLLFALLTAWVYAGFFRKDRLACNLGLWGMLGGMLGFPTGQSLQAFHAWNRETVFTRGIWEHLDPHMNWWNMMETTYGAVMGATLGLGLWLNRDKIRPETEEKTFSLSVEAALLIPHLFLLVSVEFLEIDWVDMVYDLGLIMVLIPLVGVAGGRWWPYLQVMPLILIPIAGKTVRYLVYDAEAIAPVAGWLIYLLIPLSLAVVFALWMERKSRTVPDGRPLARWLLLAATWTFFGLNYAFFHFPWPWAPWTSRTPNGIIFTVCAVALTGLVLFKKIDGGPGDRKESLSTEREVPA